MSWIVSGLCAGNVAWIPGCVKFNCGQSWAAVVWISMNTFPYAASQGHTKRWHFRWQRCHKDFRVDFPSGSSGASGCRSALRLWLQLGRFWKDTDHYHLRRCYEPGQTLTDWHRMKELEVKTFTAGQGQGLKSEGSGWCGVLMSCLGFSLAEVFGLGIFFSWLKCLPHFLF